MPMVFFSYEMTIYELCLLLFCDLSTFKSFFYNKKFNHLSFFAMALFLAYYVILVFKILVCFGNEISQILCSKNFDLYFQG